MTEIANIYDRLFRFESRKKVVNYPIHKKLKFGSDDGLLDWIDTKVEFLKDEHVLDAGCGTGHSLFHLCKNNDISGTGISISNDEIEFANRESARLNFSERIKFRLMDYNDNLPELYDKVLAIESLKHSDNLAKTIHNLLGSLTVNGNMIIADDFLTADTESAKKHKELWNAYSFTTKERLKNIIQNCGDFNLETYDLTEFVPVRSWASLVFVRTLVDAVAMFAFKSMKRNIKTYKGALLLEGLYKKKQAVYYVFIIKRKNNGR